MSKPFLENKIKGTNSMFRYFDIEKYGNPCVWHKDKKTRYINLHYKTENENGFALLQLDNQLPKDLSEKENFWIKIPKETYHRLIIGKGLYTLLIEETDE